METKEINRLRTILEQRFRRAIKRPENNYKSYNYKFEIGPTVFREITMIMDENIKMKAEIKRLKNVLKNDSPGR